MLLIYSSIYVQVKADMIKETIPPAPPENKWKLWLSELFLFMGFLPYSPFYCWFVIFPFFRYKVNFLYILLFSSLLVWRYRYLVLSIFMCFCFIYGI